MSNRRALLITGYTLAETLITTERPDVLGAMILCAQSVAYRLREDLGVGDGCLEWQLESRKIGDIHRLFPSFGTAHKRNPLQRGKRYLRKCP